VADGWNKRVIVVQWWTVAGGKTPKFTEGEKPFLLETGQPSNQGILVNLKVAELLNELPVLMEPISFVCKTVHNLERILRA
jgi:hypothetical protein